MGTYVAPADIWVSCTWQCHRDRPNGGSPEPGTDYATSYGTDLRIAEGGYVSVIDHSNGGGEGRRLSVDLDDGRRVSYIHLSGINAYIGQRVERGQQGVIWSGASGNGNDWYYASHVHVSLWEHPGMAYRDTIDFEPHIGDPDEPIPPIIQEVIMASIIITHTGEDGDYRNGITLVSESQARHLTSEEVDFINAWTTSDGKLLNTLSKGFFTGGNPRAYDHAVNIYGPGPKDAPLPLHSGKGVTVAADPASSSSLVKPAWTIGFILGVIGFIEVVKFILDVVVT